MILVIDHRDSFVHNLARCAELAGSAYMIRNCDEINAAEAAQMSPEAIILSSGPCTPTEAGVSVELIRALGGRVPFLGVCLGHQCIGAAYGARIVRSAPMHGMASVIHHNGEGVFENMPQDFEGGRYHSLAVELDADSPLKITARTEDGIIMGLQHETYPVYGVQFHPESILTAQGMEIIRNFVNIAQARPRHKGAA
ncbi:MAG: anthranilate synthase component II [Alphaproteobacteria bacterium]